MTEPKAIAKSHSPDARVVRTEGEMRAAAKLPPGNTARVLKKRHSVPPALKFSCAKVDMLCCPMLCSAVFCYATFCPVSSAKFPPPARWLNFLSSVFGTLPVGNELREWYKQVRGSCRNRLRTIWSQTDRIVPRNKPLQKK